jgi:hypothetical protein
VTSVASCGRLSSSYWGTFDQAGNAAEWVESHAANGKRQVRGGSYDSGLEELTQGHDRSDDPTVESQDIGFRVASPL